MKKLLILVALLAIFPCLHAQQVSGNQYFAPGTGDAVQVPNDGTTGTRQYYLAKLTGTPSSAVITATTDTSGIEGVVIDGAGKTGNALIVKAGETFLLFDGATTAGDYVQQSVTAVGEGHDAGASCPSSGQVVGKVLSTNAGPGLYVIMVGSEDCASSAGASATFQVNGTNTANQSTINFLNASAFNGLTFSFSNPALGNVQPALSGALGPGGIGTLVAGSNGLAASATTDTTNAGNISSGILPNTRLVSIPNSALANFSVTVTPGTGLNGGGAISLGSSATLNLANTAVTPGSYTSTNLTVDAQGRVTAAANGTSGGVSSFNTRTGAVSPVANDYSLDQIGNLAGTTTNTFQGSNTWGIASAFSPAAANPGTNAPSILTFTGPSGGAALSGTNQGGAGGNSAVLQNGAMGACSTCGSLSNAQMGTWHGGRVEIDMANGYPVGVPGNVTPGYKGPYSNGNALSPDLYFFNNNPATSTMNNEGAVIESVANIWTTANGSVPGISALHLGLPISFNPVTGHFVDASGATAPDPALAMIFGAVTPNGIGYAAGATRWIIAGTETGGIAIGGSTGGGQITCILGGCSIGSTGGPTMIQNIQSSGAGIHDFILGKRTNSTTSFAADDFGGFNMANSGGKGATSLTFDLGHGAIAGTDSNIAGASGVIRAGNGTGTGGSGTLYFQSAVTGQGVGATVADVYADVMSLTPAGNVVVNNSAIIGGHLNQNASGDFANSCAMSAGTTCTFSINTTYGTVLGFASVQSASPTTFQGSCALSGTTVTITASASNSNTWGCLLIGNAS